MALQFAHGDLAWNSADAAGTNYTVSGLPFQPKFLLFLINGQADASNTATQTGSGRVCIGFASSTTSRRCMGFLDVDAAASADCQEIYRADAVVATVSATPAVDGLLDITAFNSDGFQLTVDDAAPVNLRVFWFAWGGSDITDVAIGEITEPAATGNVDYTVTGSFQPDVVLFSGCQLTAAAPTVGAQDAGLMFGAATGSGQGHQFVLVGNSDVGSASMDTDSYYRIDECLAMITIAGGNPNARANFVQFNSDGFRLNWLERGLTNRRYMYAAIKGGMWRADAFNIVQNLNNTVTVVTQTSGGQSFEPAGAFHVSRHNVEDAVDTSTVNSKLMFGAWSSLTSRRSIGYFSENGTANAEVNLSIWYDQVMADVSVAGTVIASTDIDAINADGFRIIVDDELTNWTETQAFIAFGSVPEVVPPYTTPVPGTGLLSQSTTGFRARSSRASPLLHHSSIDLEPPPAEPDTWMQPIVGVRALSQAQALYAQRVGVAARLRWFEAWADGPLETQPETWMQPVSGTAGLRTQSAQFWQRAARPHLHDTWLDAPVEPDTWTQVVSGTWSLAFASRALISRATTTAFLRWRGPTDEFVAAEPETWTQQPTPGTASWQRYFQQMWQRALLRSLQRSEYEDAPPPPPPPKERGRPFPLRFRRAHEVVEIATQEYFETRLRIKRAEPAWFGSSATFIADARVRQSATSLFSAQSRIAVLARHRTTDEVGWSTAGQMYSEARHKRHVEAAWSTSQRLESRDRRAHVDPRLRRLRDEQILKDLGEL